MRALQVLKLMAAQFPSIDVVREDQLQLHLRLGRLLLSTERVPEGIKQLDDALVLQENRSDIHNMRAWALATCADVDARDGQRAVESARRAVQLRPELGDYWNTLGAAHYRAGQWHEALTALEKSHELHQGDNPYDYLFLAMTCWQLERRAEARSWYDQAAQRTDGQPQEPETLHRIRQETQRLLEIDIDDKER